MRLSPTARWIGLALLGILIAAAVAVTGSQLASRQIGIASESVSAGDALAPAFASPHRRSHRGNRRHHRRGRGIETAPAPAELEPPAIAPEPLEAEPPAATTTEPAAPVPSAPAESSGGDDGGAGAGGGGSSGGGGSGGGKSDD